MKILLSLSTFTPLVFLYRYLIEAASGVFTGSVYTDDSLMKGGFLGEARKFSDGSTLLQKTHHLIGVKVSSPNTY